MQIAGLQKLTLLDFPGTVACIVFAPGCNLRCPFCHNSSLVFNTAGERIPQDEVLSFLKKRLGLLDGVVVTGGEPLLQTDIADFITSVKELGYKVKLDTNGTRPDLLKRLVADGLIDRVAMDIKSSPENYPSAVGIRGLDITGIEESKDFLLGGDIDCEFRTTVVKGIHTDADFESIAKWIDGASEYYLQQFKDSGELIDPAGLSQFTPDELSRFADIVRPFVRSVEIRGI